MSEHKTFRKMISSDLNGRSTETAKMDQRKDWGYTNQYRRMMQKRHEEGQGLTPKG